MIAQGYKANLETIIRAAKNDGLCLLECRDAATGEPVIALCAVGRDGEEFVMAPLAKLFDGNPYEELVPPMEEETV